MDENVIIKSEQTKKEPILIIGAIVGLIAGILYESLVFHFDRVTWVWLVEIGYMAVAVFLPFLISYLAFKKCELTVTDKRVYGTAAFGAKINLPIESISTVGTGSFHEIRIATTSTRISFHGIKNRDAIHEALKELKINKEYRKKCNVCGHVFCYRNSDLYRNQRLAEEAVSSSGLAVLEAVGGSRIASNQQSEAADRAMDKIVDYNRCPKCHSSDLTDATEEDIRRAANGNGNSAVSSADELKKFKELLDSGVITQEEFDAKKKQLLGL